MAIGICGSCWGLVKRKKQEHFVACQRKNGVGECLCTVRLAQVDLAQSQ